MNHAKNRSWLLLCATGVAIVCFGASSRGQNPAYGPYKGEWTRYHPHFMGHRDKAGIELQAARKVVAIASVREREMLPVEVTLKRGQAQNQFDLYLVFTLEEGIAPLGEGSLFLTPSGRYTSRPVAYEANVTLTEDRKLTVQFPIYSGLYPQAYVIYGVLVPPGKSPRESGNWIQIAQTVFAVRRSLSQPLEIGEQGNLYVGRDSFPKPGWLPPGPLVVGPLGANQGMYVNYQAPWKRLQPYPIVYVHGCLDAMAEMAPEGQEGLLTYFLRRGFGVFAITWLGQKRSGEGGKTSRAWRNQDGCNVLYEKNAEAVGELLDLIGPAIIIGKSQGGPNSYLILDRRPQLVKGAVLIAPGQVGGTAPTNYPALRPLHYDEKTGEFSLFFPFERRRWTQEGEPDFTRDFFTTGELDHGGSGGPGRLELWKAYKETPQGKNDNAPPPPSGMFPRTRGLTKNRLTPVGSPDRPTKNVTFTDSKLLIMTAEEDQNKGLDWNPAFVAGMKRAGVKDVESIELTRYNGFPHEDHYAELGQNVERIGSLILDWLVRKGLAVEVP